jgi:hypothetical protein
LSLFLTHYQRIFKKKTEKKNECLGRKEKDLFGVKMIVFIEQTNTHTIA